jgi:hypothetical protein
MSVHVRRLLALQLSEHQLQCAVFHASTLVRYEEISLDAPAPALETNLTALLEAGGKAPLVLATAVAGDRILRLESAPSAEETGPPPSTCGNSTPRTAACDARTGQAPSPGHPRLLLSAPPEGLDTARERLKTAGFTPSHLPDATLAQLGALLHAPPPFVSNVLVWDLGRDRSHFIVLNSRGIVAIEPCSVGLAHIHAAIQAEIGLRFPRAAANLFVRNSYNFSDACPRILGRLLPELENTFARITLAPTRLHVTGLNRAQQWFTLAVADALSLTPFAMDWPAFGQLNGLAFASLELAHSLPLSAGGLLLLAKQRHAHPADALWQPRWSDEPEPPPREDPETTPAPAAVVAPRPAATPRRRHPVFKALGALHANLLA